MPFNAHNEKDRLIEWLKEYFIKNGNQTEAVVGISGGKDSTIVAALCVEAIGADRVVGIQMPNKVQRDMADSNAVISYLGIKRLTVNINRTISALYDTIAIADGAEFNSTMRNNLDARIRMSILYAYANQYGARVACTNNLSEAFVGWNTRWGDDIGDFAPIRALTSTEVVAIGAALGLPPVFTHKVPEDGLTGRTDEENFGFSYKHLDAFIRGDRSMPVDVQELILKRHHASQFKRDPIPIFVPLH